MKSSVGLSNFGILNLLYLSQYSVCRALLVSLHIVACHDDCLRRQQLQWN